MKNKIDNIEIIQGDLTEMNLDIIVNAANHTLLGGGGIDGTIHRKAGPLLLEECKKLNGCEIGSAKMTDAYNLPCKKIIHACGPMYYGHEEDSPDSSDSDDIESLRHVAIFKMWKDAFINMINDKK